MAKSGKKGPELERYRGDTTPHVFTVQDSDGVAVDVSTWTNFVMTINSELDPSDTTNQLVTFTGSFQTDGTDGKVEFTPADTAAADQVPGNYFYDAQALDGSARVVTLAKNKYTFHQDIGKA